MNIKMLNSQEAFFCTLDTFKIQFMNSTCNSLFSTEEIICTWHDGFLHEFISMLVMLWPLQSPDRSLTQMLWDILGPVTIKKSIFESCDSWHSLHLLYQFLKTHSSVVFDSLLLNIYCLWQHMKAASIASHSSGIMCFPVKALVTWVNNGNRNDYL